MSIDEAISKYKEITNTDAICPGHCNIPCEKCVQESEQFVEWLEELKDYRDKNKMVVRVDVDSIIKDKIEELSKYAESQYDKAIDAIKEKLMQNGFIYTQHALDVFNEIAKQLKADGDNENTNQKES